MSNESGRIEVHVRPFPGPGGRWQISTNGGGHPTWSPTKRELFYGTQGQIMVAAFSADGRTFRAEKPRLWSEAHYETRGTARMFDLHRDGERFALAPAGQAPVGAKLDKIVFIFGFFDELRRTRPRLDDGYSGENLRFATITVWTLNHRVRPGRRRQASSHLPRAPTNANWLRPVLRNDRKAAARFVAAHIGAVRACSPSPGAARGSRRRCGPGRVSCRAERPGGISGAIVAPHVVDRNRPPQD
jgi:hypothetical protein